ncbi:O-antigen ligase family protein [Haloarcula hispanica]|nr:O-antigen ligase family protein [Haloarcula hispanica]
MYNPFTAEAFLGLLLLFSSLNNTSASETTYLLTAIPTLTILLFYTLLRRPLPDLVVSKFAFTLIMIIWGSYFISFIIPPVEVSEFMRIFPFFVANLCVIFWIPNVINAKSFIRQLSVVSCVLTLIGLPTAVLGAYSVGPLQISGVGESFSLFQGVELWIVSSIFDNQNIFSMIAALGSVSSLGAYIFTRKMLYQLSTILCLIGLFLAQGRASILASILGIGIILVHQVAGAKQFRQVVALGAVTSLITTFCVLWIFPIEHLVSAIELSGREYLWPAGVKAIINNPIFGIGIDSTSGAIAPYLSETLIGSGVHNTYLYIFLTAGIVGGTAYLLLVSQMGLTALLRINSSEGITIFALFAGLLTIQMFSSSPFFGFSVRPIVTGLTFGYLLQMCCLTEQPQ